MISTRNIGRTAASYAVLAAAAGFGARSGARSGACSAAPSSFIADFSVNASPIGAPWHMSGSYNAVVRTVSGVAQNTQTGSGTNGNGFDDGYALLAPGFGPNVHCQATVRQTSFSTSGQAEFEILVCATEIAGVTRAIECNVAHDGGYHQMIAWTGGTPPNSGSFVVLATGNIPGGTVVTGDVYEVSVSGSVVTTTYNGTQTMSVDLATALPAHSLLYSDYSSSSRMCGMAFYTSQGVGSDTGVLGFSAFSAQVLP